MKRFWFLVKGALESKVLWVGSSLMIVCAGCGPSNSTEPRGTAQPPLQRERGYGQSAQPGSSFRQQQAALLNDLRQADPSHRTFEKAVLNENNELGLVLSRNVEVDQIPALMQSVLSGMAKRFPGQDLTVIAYAPSNPPLKMGTARLDARSRKMSYTPENNQRF